MKANPLFVLLILLASISAMAQNDHPGSKVLCLLHALDDNAVRDYAKANGGISYDWAEEAGYDSDATSQPPAYNAALEKAKRAVFTFRGSGHGYGNYIYWVHLGESNLPWRSDYYNPDTKYIYLEEWAKAVDVPLWHHELMEKYPGKYKNLKGGDDYKSETIIRPGYMCNLTYSRVDKNDKKSPFKLNLIRLSTVDGEEDKLPQCNCFNYPGQKTVEYTRGCNSGDCENGKGVMYFDKDDALYEGYFKDGTMHGKGKLTYLGRPYAASEKSDLITSFEGDYLFGKPCGRATILYYDGRKYEGQVKGWDPHGQGDMYPKGWEYAGGSGTQRGNWFYEGKWKSYDRPYEINFDDCDIIRRDGAIKFSAAAFDAEAQSVVNKFEKHDSLASAIINKASACVKQLDHELKYISMLYGCADEMAANARKMATLNLNYHTLRLHSMAVNANCYKNDQKLDVVSVAERMKNLLFQADLEADIFAQEMEKMAVRIRAIKDKNVAFNDFASTVSLINTGKYESIRWHSKEFTDLYLELKDARCK